MNEYKLSKQLVDVIADVKIPEEIKIKKVKYLLYLGADVNAYSDFNDMTVLMMAVKKGNLEMVKVLAQNGANVNLRDDEGATALMHASIEGKKDVVKVLLNEGADASLRDGYGVCALDLARENQRYDVVKILEEHLENKTEETMVNMQKHLGRD